MKTIHIYSDESRHKQERFLLLAGLWIEESNIQFAHNEVLALRKKHGFINSSGQEIDFQRFPRFTKFIRIALLTLLKHE